MRKYRRRRLPKIPRKVQSNARKITKILRGIESKYITYSDTDSMSIQRMDHGFATHVVDTSVTCLDILSGITQGTSDTFQRIGDKIMLTSLSLSYMVSPALTLDAGLIPLARVYVLADYQPVATNGAANYPTFDALFQSGNVNVDSTAGGSPNVKGAICFRDVDKKHRFRILYSKVHRAGSLGGSGVVKFNKLFKSGLVVQYNAASQITNNIRLWLVMTSDTGVSVAASNRPLLRYFLRVRFNDS